MHRCTPAQCRPGPLAGLASVVLVAAACSSPAEPGYLELPDACTLVAPSLIEDHLGPAATSETESNTTSPASEFATSYSTCTWQTGEAPPLWGLEADFGDGQIQVATRIEYDGSNDEPKAERTVRAFTDRLEEGLGLSRSIEVGPYSEGMDMYVRVDSPGNQIHTVLVRRENLLIEVEFRGFALTVDDDLIVIPRDEHKAATYEIVRQVNRNIGEPR